MAFLTLSRGRGREVHVEPTQLRIDPPNAEALDPVGMRRK